MQTLQPNTLLQGGRYKVIKTLGHGGFGITYLAIQSGLEREVAVKEFFMKDFCERDCATSHVTLGMETSRDMVKRFRAKFIKEARNIAKLNHPNIVRIIDVFEENGTAYYVMEYAKGGSLGEKLRKKGCFSKPVATRYITQVAEAVGYIHQRKMNHLDIKPDNIMLSGDDNVILIDFGLAKQYDAATGGQTSSTPIGISEGYAPIEQYQIGGVASFTPETDIYALGATYFKMLTGITPPSAPSLLEDGVSIESLKAKRVSKNVVDTILHSMYSKKKDRFHSIEDFLQGLRDYSNSNKVKSLISDKEEMLVLNEKVLTFDINGVSFEMVRIDSGSFVMGATSDMEETEEELEECGYIVQSIYEKPIHKVTLCNYYIGRTVVTQKLWTAIMGANPSKFRGANKPVENISWSDCQVFISKLNALTGKVFRLPTEAEWEFAARGGNLSRHYRYSGSDTLANVAWCDITSEYDTTSDVAKKQPNELGLYDMSGNVFEWCSDWYGDYSCIAQHNPMGAKYGESRVARGGSWLDGSVLCRVSSRSCFSADTKDYFIGLRLALSE